MALASLPVVTNEIGGKVPARPAILVDMDGNAAGARKTVAVTPVVSATPDYSDGDNIGGLMTVAAIVSADGAGGMLSHVLAVSKAAISVAIDLLIFNANPTGSTFTDNEAAVVAAADLPKLIGKTTLAGDGWVSLSGAQILQTLAPQVPISGNAADDIFVAMIARGTVNLGSTSDLSFRFSAS